MTSDTSGVIRSLTVLAAVKMPVQEFVVVMVVLEAGDAYCLLSTTLLASTRVE